MKILISIPNSILILVDEPPRQRGLSRDAVFSQAVEEYLGRHRHERATEKLNEIYSAEPSSLDSFFSELQIRSLPPEVW